MEYCGLTIAGVALHQGLHRAPDILQAVWQQVSGPSG